MNELQYTPSLAGITAANLAGLPHGWPKPPSGETVLKSLNVMNARMLAVDKSTGQVVGYACGMTDGVLILYVWDVELRPEYSGRGIEREMLHRLFQTVGDIYQINANPDERGRPVFEGLGFVALRRDQACAMTRMRMDCQDGGPKAAR